uniref:Uncharacterized protein n=1 Tax=Arundo donax TaxID=35708 RepID=A0A0A9H773_ARUDO
MVMSRYSVYLCSKNNNRYVSFCNSFCMLTYYSLGYV